MRGYQSIAGASELNLVAYDLGQRAINLPSALMLTELQVDRACCAFRKTLDEACLRS
jgi:hypothetical protein